MSGGNQHGSIYQAQAMHRAMRSLSELPQLTEESLRVCEIIDEINRHGAYGF